MEETLLAPDELAAHVGVSVSDLEEWQRLGLLHAGPDGRFDTDAVERVRLITYASERGVGPADIARLADAEGTDVLARYIDFLGGPRPPGCTLDEAAEAAGIDAAFARRLWVAAGLGERELFEPDVEMLRLAATAVALGLPEEALLQLVRVFSDALMRVADAENRLFHIHVHEPLRASGRSLGEVAETVQAMSGPMRELIEPALLYFHRRASTRASLDDMVVHLREDLAPREGDVGTTPVAVLFVDLASFTPLTEAMGDAEAARVIDRFSDMVREAVSLSGGRVLKQIGDEFMIVFTSSSTAVACGVDIAGRAAHEPHFPAIRMGLHSGTAMYREADFLGATVNIAARVAGEAGRGEFLVTDIVRSDASGLDGVDFEPIGRRALKGVAAEVELFAVRHLASDVSRAVDPVCGMHVDDEQCVPLRWDGVDLCFCSETCRERFLEAPDRYL